MATYIHITDIQSSMSSEQYAKLTEDGGAAAFALKKTNDELKSILGKEYVDIADVPSNIRSEGGIVARYWLHSYHGIIDKEHAFYVDYTNAVKNLKEIAAGSQSGINDPTDEDNAIIQHKANDRRFNNDMWE